MSRQTVWIFADRASLRCSDRRVVIVSSSESPVVVDQSTPDPNTSLAKTISVAMSVRRQSLRLSGLSGRLAPSNSLG